MARSSNPFQVALRPATLYAPGRPPRSLDYGDPPIDLAAELGRRAPLLLEIGAGQGDFLFETAAARPDWDFLALEMASARARSLAGKALRLDLANVLVLGAVAELALGSLVPAACARELHIHFPDPWPKKRHHKRRLLGARFAPGVIEALAPGGLLCVMTDQEDYALEALQTLEALPQLTNLCGPASFASRPEEPLTYYQSLCLAQGRPIYYMKMQRRE